MSFLGSTYTGNTPNNFYTPEPRGVDASKWSQYPALQNVDMDNFDLENVNNLTANNIIATEKIVNNLTVVNDASVGGNVSVSNTLDANGTTIQNRVLSNVRDIVFDGSYGLNPRINANGQGGGQEIIYIQGNSLEGKCRLGGNGASAGIFLGTASQGTTGIMNVRDNATSTFPFIVDPTNPSVAPVRITKASVSDNLTVDGRIFANEDIEVVGLTKTHGIDALGDITTTSNLSIDGDATIAGILYQTGNQIFIGQGTQSNGFNMVLECDTGGELGKLGLQKDPFAFSSFIDLIRSSPDFIQFNKPILTAENIVQGGIGATGTTTLLSTTVQDLSIGSFSALEDTTTTGGQQALQRSSVGDKVQFTEPPNSADGAGLVQTTLPTNKSVRREYRMTSPSLQLVEISLLERASGVKAAGLHHTIVIHRPSGSGTVDVRVQVVASGGGPSPSRLLGYMDMSGGSIGPRGIAQQYTTSSPLSQDIHFVEIWEQGDGSNDNIQYFTRIS